MSKHNGIQLLYDSLELSDARASLRPLSVLQATEMSRACDKFLAKRGIIKIGFCRMDFGLGNRYTKKKKDTE